MRVDWCVSSWFRIKNTHSLTHERADAAWDSLSEMSASKGETPNLISESLLSAVSTTDQVGVF